MNQSAKFLFCFVTCPEETSPTKTTATTTVTTTVSSEHTAGSASLIGGTVASGSAVSLLLLLCCLIYVWRRSVRKHRNGEVGSSSFFFTLDNNLEVIEVVFCYSTCRQYCFVLPGLSPMCDSKIVHSALL